MTEVSLAAFDPRTDRVEWAYRRVLGVLLVAGEAQQATMTILASGLRSFGVHAACTAYLSAVWDRRSYGGGLEPRPEQLASLLGDSAPQEHLDRITNDLTPTDGLMIVLAPGWAEKFPTPHQGLEIVNQGIIGVQRMAWLYEDTDFDDQTGRVIERHVAGHGWQISHADGRAFEPADGPPGEGRYAFRRAEISKAARYLLGTIVRAGNAKLVRK